MLDERTQAREAATSHAFTFNPHTRNATHAACTAQRTLLYTHAELNDYYEYVAQLLRSTTAAA